MLERINHVCGSKIAFSLYFGLCVPLVTVGIVVLAFRDHVALGLLATAINLAWIWETGRTTCRRCWAYGTLGCGLPSLMAPLFGRRLPPRSVTRRRVLVHHAVDWAGGVYLNVGYAWLCPRLFPLVLAWSVGAWWMVARPRRYHGLLNLLRTKDDPAAGAAGAVEGDCGLRTTLHSLNGFWSPLPVWPEGVNGHAGSVVSEESRGRWTGG